MLFSYVSTYYVWSQKTLGNQNYSVPPCPCVRTRAKKSPRCFYRGLKTEINQTCEKLWESEKKQVSWKWAKMSHRISVIYLYFVFAPTENTLIRWEKPNLLLCSGKPLDKNHALIHDFFWFVCSISKAMRHSF